MAKEQSLFPANRDILEVDRVAGDDVPSIAFDVLESAVTQIEAEMRRVTSKSSTCTLLSSESGVIKLTAAAPWNLTLPLAADYPGIPYLLFKEDDNSYLINILPSGTDKINGLNSYGELNYKNSWVYFKSNGEDWDVIFKSKSLDMGEW